MREIKFRGKRTDNGEWVEGYYCKSYGRHNGYIYDYHSIYDYELGEHYEVIPETVGEYTGLPDKNGKKIWEGDIVKHYNNAFQDRVDVKTNIYEVKYHEKYCYFYLARKQNNLLFDGNWSYYLKEIEVIGNIHDNSELLK